MRTLNSNPKNKTSLNNKKKNTENTNKITNNKESLTDGVLYLEILTCILWSDGKKNISESTNEIYQDDECMYIRNYILRRSVPILK
jgi:hypothetical protein